MKASSARVRPLQCRDKRTGGEFARGVPWFSWRNHLRSLGLEGKREECLPILHQTHQSRWLVPGNTKLSSRRAHPTIGQKSKEQVMSTIANPLGAPSPAHTPPSNISALMLIFRIVRWTVYAC